MQVKKHMNLLGLKCKDKVTGLAGVITSVSFDLYGCVQALVTPAIDKDTSKYESFWLDMNRLNITGKKPVMDVPDFDYGPVAEGKKGPADKPMPSRI